MSRTFLPGTLVRHYKGQLYLIEATRVFHSESLEPHVLYRALYPSTSPGIPDYALWIRPEKMFYETIKIEDQEVLRFAPLTE